MILLGIDNVAYGMNLSVHTWILLENSFVGPNKGPNMAVTRLLMERGGMRGGIGSRIDGIPRNFPVWQSSPAPNTVNPLHHSYCPQFWGRFIKICFNVIV